MDEEDQKIEVNEINKEDEKYKKLEEENKILKERCAKLEKENKDLKEESNKIKKIKQHNKKLLDELLNKMN